MSRTIHGLSHQGLKAFRGKSAALPVYWIYVSRMNNEGVAWPSARGLAKDTGWNKATCLEARDYLIEIKALEAVKEYVRPEWRDKPAQEKTRKMNFDRSEYYRPTGYIMIGEKKFKMLYNGGEEASSIDEKVSDVLPNRTSAQTGHPATPDIQFGSTELNSRIELGSSNSELSSSKEKENAPKPSKKLPYPENTKVWTWKHLEQYAGENPNVQILVCFDDMKKKLTELTTQAAQDLAEIHMELTRLKVAPERWDSLRQAGEKKKKYDASIFKRMFWALEGWIKTPTNITAITPPSSAPPPSNGEYVRPLSPAQLDEKLAREKLESERAS